MAKPNYGFEKRQRELEKKRKKEEKAMKKATGGGSAPETPDGDASGEPSPAPPEAGQDAAKS